MKNKPINIAKKYSYSLGSCEEKKTLKKKLEKKI